MKRFFVHAYYVVRSKVAVEAEDHVGAMKAADAMLPDIHKRLEVNTCGCVNNQRDIVNASDHLPMHLDTESAEEVTGYMVDEVDDDQYERSVAYNASHEREQPDLKTLKVTGEERDTILAALRFWQSMKDESIEYFATGKGEAPRFDDLLAIAANEHNQPLDSKAIGDLCERLNT